MIVATKFRTARDFCGFVALRQPLATTASQSDRSAAAAWPATGPGEYAWVDSGDRSYRADGEIYVTGRVKDIIIKGGRNYIRTKSRNLRRALRNSQGCIVAFG